MGPAKCWECRGYTTPGQIRQWHRVAWLVHAVIKGQWHSQWEGGGGEVEVAEAV